MKRTALACILLTLMSWGAANWLTLDFSVWTAEGARRQEIANRPLESPEIAVQGPGVPTQSLQHLLAADDTVTIVDFMYTRCISVCAALGSAFQQMQAEIAQTDAASGGAKVRLLSISFDPEFDDIPVLEAYASSLRANPEIWRFARVANPDDESAKRRLLEHYQVTVIADGLGGFEHNAALLMVDPKGRLVRVFDYDQLDTALAFARALSRRGST